MNPLKYLFTGFLILIAAWAFSVPELILHVDGEHGNDLKSGLDWDQARKTIQSAIDTAHSWGLFTKVFVKRGEYSESIAMKSHVALYGGFAGHEKLISERNIEENRTIIDPRSAVSDKPVYHVVIMDGLNNALIDGFVITGGDARGEGIDADGGGILCLDLEETCSISNCMIIWNKAKRYGGGVYWSPESRPNIVNCQIIMNFASWGGGVFCGGSPKTAFQSCVIRNNTATGDDSKGGGVYSLGETRFVQCNISFNKAAYGGGVYCYGKALFDKSFFIQNVASYGAAVYCRDEVDIDRSTFSANSARLGGALRINAPGAVIKNSILWKNSGGAISFSKHAPEVSYSCVEDGFPGTGNISSDPEFIGWSSLTDIYIASSYKGESDGSIDKPFPDIQKALENFNFYLSDRSPCLKTAKGGADMGAEHQVMKWAGNKSVTFHLAEGEYDVSSCSFDWNVSLEGAGIDKTILVGGARGLRSGCHIKNLTITKSISSGLVIPQNENPVVENCAIRGNKTLELGGGVTLQTGASPRFTNCLISGNFSKKRGGALYCDEKTSGTFYNCAFQENSSGSDAGAIFIAPLSNVRFLHCTIEDNLTSHDGGAVYCDAESAPLFQNCIIRRNASHLGGGAWCSPGSSPAFLESRFIDNLAAFGAGTYIDGSAALFERCDFISNNSWYGGGVYLLSGSDASFINCALRFNRAKSGGGVYSYRANPSFHHCVIEGNDARKLGGGVFCFGANPRMNHCEIISNNAARGGAVASFKDSPIIDHCVLWDNDGGQIDFDLEPLRVRYSCIEGGWEGPGNISTNPGFVGWGDWTDVYIDAATTSPLDGTASRPFKDIKSALSLYVSALGSDSPCVNSGENGKYMGVGKIADVKKGNPSVTFHIAPGNYDLSERQFLKRVSLEGSGADKTFLRGSLRGLRSGCSLRGATISGSRSSGVHIGAHQNPLVEKCRITDNMAGALNFNGAGIFIGSYASPLIKDCVISKNRVTENFPDTGGAGIYCDVMSQPRFQRCRVEENSAGGNAGGVYCVQAQPVFECCFFTGNLSGENGGAFFCDQSSPSFINCVFDLNIASLDGGALFGKIEASPAFHNCVLSENLAKGKGSALYLFRSNPSIANSIIWNNADAPFYLSRSSIVIEYSNVQGGFEGQGNLNVDPFFVSPASWSDISGKSELRQGDYNLKALSQEFQEDSPCIDAGNPDPQFNDAARPPGRGGERCDMGAFGGPGNLLWLDFAANADSSLGKSD